MPPRGAAPAGEGGLPGSRLRLTEHGIRDGPVGVNRGGAPPPGGSATPGCYARSVRIAVVIPALDEAEAVAGAIASARAPGVEVVVVDGGSRDGTADRAREAGARVVTAPPGRARQLQAGFAATEADAVVFLHADTRLPPGFSDLVRRALAEPAVVGGAFGFRFRESGAALRVVEWGARLRSRWLRLPYGDQALFCRARVLRELGGVPQVPIMEDVDLVASLRRRGRVVLLPADVRTSARRYLERGVARTVLRNGLALLGRALGLPRERLATWYRG